jgi:SAM-dependent methyltransferase
VKQPINLKSFAAECKTAIQRHSSSLTPHDRALLQQVVGLGGTEEGFLYGGFTGSVGIRAALRTLGKSVYDFESILDFGCGSGRIVRWFGDVTPRSRLFGCDINSEAIQWCKQNIQFCDFIHSNPVPPLPYTDHSFDLIYGISVVTHLDEGLQLSWLDELRRLIKPGGVILLSVHGEDKAPTDLNPEERQQYDAAGFLYKRATEMTSVEGLPDFYQVAFHSTGYIERVWSQYFDVLGYQKHGCMYTQDLVMMRGRGIKSIASNSASQPITVDLPMAVIDTPVLGITVTQSELNVDGWAFYPAGRKLTLEFKIDGETVLTCTPEMSRPDVGKFFFAYPAAGTSGFSVGIPVNNLRLMKGWHVLWISSDASDVPLCVIYFKTLESWTTRELRKLIYRIRIKVRFRTRMRELIKRDR